jgi:hypothetical protein
MTVTPLQIILLVLFALVLGVWLLALLGVILAAATSWLAFFACLLLGVAVFLPPGSGRLP